ncbi:hypothetical protein HK102_005513 [Quaeritorhiza haematococci]|nr:hypothetical protein HK102_005513 [Quaeritorhiza haematococci]
MQVPESLAFAFLAGITPLQGLHSTFFIGLLAGAFGGRPGMISGIAGAMAVIMGELTADHGPLGYKCYSERVDVLLAVAVFTGLMQVLLAILHVPKLLRLLPYSVHIGFLNGLAIIVFKAQLGVFRVDADDATTQVTRSISSTNVTDDPKCANSFLQGPQRWLRLDELQTYLVLILIVISMGIMHFQSRIKGRIRLGKRASISSKIIPGSLTAMIVCTAIEHGIYRAAFKVSTKTVGDVASLKGSLPTFHIPAQLTLSSSDPGLWGIVLQYSAILCAIGTIESLMTMELCAELLKEELGPYAGIQETIAQGLGNLLSGFFGAVGGSAMVGQSAVNVLNGAQGRLSSVSAAWFIFILIVAAGPAIELLPIATLAGILFLIVIHAFEWRTFKFIIRRQMPLSDIITVILVTVLAVVTDLAIAVVSGVIWSCLVFAWNASSVLMLKEHRRVLSATHSRRLIDQLHPPHDHKPHEGGWKKHVSKQLQFPGQSRSDMQKKLGADSFAVLTGEERVEDNVHLQQSKGSTVLDVEPAYSQQYQRDKDEESQTSSPVVVIHHVQVYGPLFFASVPRFRKYFLHNHRKHHRDHHDVHGSSSSSSSPEQHITLLDFTHSSVLDYSAVDALKRLSKQFHDSPNQRLLLVYLDEASRRKVLAAGKLWSSVLAQGEVLGADGEDSNEGGVDMEKVSDLENDEGSNSGKGRDTECTINGVRDRGTDSFLTLTGTVHRRGKELEVLEIEEDDIVGDGYIKPGQAPEDVNNILVVRDE